jgi:hydroxymethylpyrimidine/phosphomethylpyrimidine kinase
MYKVLSIAGSDCSGGAGIQADLKTITAHKMYGMSVITALTAQNTTGVSGIYDVNPEFVAKQLDMVFTDIFPDAVKIGMVSNHEIIEIIADKLLEHKAKRVVLDPVMLATSGSRLLSGDALQSLITKLLPLAEVITPNIPEAEALCGFPITDKADMQRAAKQIAMFYSGSILIKGGHLSGHSDDLLYSKGEYQWFHQERIENPNTHGTGCTLSSALACNLAAGKEIIEAVARAKAYITGALHAGLKLGYGNGPINHCWSLM